MKAARRDAAAKPRLTDGGSTPARSRVGGEPVAEKESGCTVHEGLRRLVHLLPRVARGLRRPGAAGNDGVPLGSRHSSVLILVRDGEVSVGTVAEYLGLNLTTASGLIADLERAGLLQRLTDPADRRRTLVTISAAQHARVDAWIEGATAPIERALEQLSGESALCSSKRWCCSRPS